jgi:plasmid stabilization system protein ParE
MTQRVVYSPRAQHQLGELYLWIVEQSGLPDRAHDFTTAINEHCDGLAAAPMLGRARNDLRPGYEPSASAVSSSRSRCTTTSSRSTASSTVARTTRPTSTTGTPDRPKGPLAKRRHRMDDEYVVILILILQARSLGASGRIQMQVPHPPDNPNVQLRASSSFQMPDGPPEFKSPLGHSKAQLRGRGSAAVITI